MQYKLPVTDFITIFTCCQFFNLCSTLSLSFLRACWLVGNKIELNSVVHVYFILCMAA